MINAEDVGYEFDFRQVCLTYAFIGLVLTRGARGHRAAIGHPACRESVLASGGALVEIVGFVDADARGGASVAATCCWLAWRSWSPVSRS